jgi:hypothetical protein
MHVADFFDPIYHWFTCCHLSQSCLFYHDLLLPLVDDDDDDDDDGSELFRKQAVKLRVTA